MSRGLFLDLDGTLADSLGVMRQAYGRFLRRVGAAPSDEEFESLNGPPLPEIVRLLKARWEIEGAESDLLGVYEALVDEAYEAVAPADHALEALTAARRRGWIVGVVTSNSQLRTRRWLARVGLASEVSLIVAGEDAPRGKPAPDPYRKALQISGADPTLSLAVEDSLSGVTAALAADLTTLAIDPNLDRSWPERARPIRGLKDLLLLV
jgi:HAD superfamily hydrolase (TIGR01509 family)